MEYMHISELNFGPLRIYLRCISLISYLSKIIVEYLTSNILHRAVHSTVITFPLRGHTEKYVAVDKPSFIYVASHRVPAIGMMKSNMLFTDHCGSKESFVRCIVNTEYIYFCGTVNPVHM